MRGEEGANLPVTDNPLLLHCVRLFYEQIKCAPLLKNKPLVAFALFCVDEMEFAFQPLALEDDFETAGLLLGNLKGARVPNSDGAGPIPALRNRSFEIDIVDRVVLDHHSEPLDPLLCGYPLRDGPALKNHLPRGLIRLEVVGREFQSEIIMVADGVMVVDDKPPTMLRTGFTARLRGLIKTSFFSIFFECHEDIIWRNARRRLALYFRTPGSIV